MDGNVRRRPKRQKIIKCRSTDKKEVKSRKTSLLNAICSSRVLLYLPDCRSYKKKERKNIREKEIEGERDKKERKSLKRERKMKK